MILYLAGSFPHLYSLNKEKDLMKKIEKKHEYHRLTSFFYPKTCNTILQIKGERIGMKPNLMETKKGKTNQDFEMTKEKSLKIAEILKAKHKWILDLRFTGDISFKSGRRKTEIKAAADRGEEVSFGLNMTMTYLDEKNKKRETQIIIRHKDKPFYNVYLKSYIPNPTKEDLIKQMVGIWIYLLAGGTVEKPKAIALTKLGEYPPECIADASAKGQRGRFVLHFNKWIKYTLLGNTIFGEDAEIELFNKLRKG
jgi:hypothetical protein